MKQEVEASGVKMNMLQRQIDDEKNKVEGLRLADKESYTSIESLKKRNEQLLKNFDERTAELEKLFGDKSKIEDECRGLRMTKVTLFDEKFKLEESLKRSTAETSRLLHALEDEQKKVVTTERRNNKLLSENRDLAATKLKLTNEKNEAITERDNTRRYLTAIEREFSWLKRKTEEE